MQKSLLSIAVLNLVVATTPAAMLSIPNSAFAAAQPNSASVQTAGSLNPGAAASPRAVSDTDRDPLFVLTRESERAYSALFAMARSVVLEPNATEWTQELLRTDADPILRGTLIGERLRRSNASFWELRNWLNQYGDLAIAADLYQVAETRRPFGETLAPPSLDLRQSPSSSQTNARAATAQGQTSKTDNSRRNYDPRSFAHAYNTEALFLAGKDQAAIAAGLISVQNPIGGLAGFSAGLAAFRQNQIATAAELFEAAASAPDPNLWRKAGSHYWAARCLILLSRNDEARVHLQAAQQYSETFYGVLARRQLASWQEPVAAAPMSVASPINKAAANDIARSKAAEETVQLRALLNSNVRARRVAALAQIQELDLAQQEFAVLKNNAQSVQERATILRLAARLHLVEGEYVAQDDIDVSADFEEANASPAANYPILSSKPKGGFRLKKALMFAVIRQESRFNPAAISGSNARGLMQILPSTAAWIAREAIFRTNPRLLHDPIVNMTVGQNYLEYLLSEFDGDLLLALAAYNAGPGTIGKWKSNPGKGSDPLLQIESLPKAETRDYVEKVLANYWLYSQRFGQAAPSLDEAIAGRKIVYGPLAPKDPDEPATAPGTLPDDNAQAPVLLETASPQPELNRPIIGGPTIAVRAQPELDNPASNPSLLADFGVN